MNINKFTCYIKNSYLNADKKSMSAFYNEGVKNPSLALVFERAFIRSQQDKLVKTPWGYTHFNNLEFKYRELKEDKSIKTSANAFFKHFKKLYPKTAILRTILCKMDRIRIDNVTPRADLFEKNHIAHSLKTYEKARVFSDNYLILKHR